MAPEHHKGPAVPKESNGDLFDGSDAVGIGHYFRLERLVLLQTLHLVLDVSHVLKTLLLCNLQLVFDPTFGLADTASIFINIKKLHADIKVSNQVRGFLKCS